MNLIYNIYFSVNNGGEMEEYKKSNDEVASERSELINLLYEWCGMYKDKESLRSEVIGIINELCHSFIMNYNEDGGGYGGVN